MARMKFLCDAERCIECNGCVVACKNEHEVPWGVNRRRVVVLDDGGASSLFLRGVPDADGVATWIEEYRNVAFEEAELLVR